MVEKYERQVAERKNMKAFSNFDKLCFKYKAPSEASKKKWGFACSLIFLVFVFYFWKHLGHVEKTHVDHLAEIYGVGKDPGDLFNLEMRELLSVVQELISIWLTGILWL